MLSHLVTVGFALYMGAAVVSYAALMILSFSADRKYIKTEGKRAHNIWWMDHGHAPSVTILAPAKNEEKIILDSIKAFLRLPYPNLKLMIVDDGSDDQTLAIIQREYQLVPKWWNNHLNRFKHKPIINMWSSSIEPRLTVVQKHASHGSKGDANNAGLEIIHSQYVFVSDIDSVVETNAIKVLVARMQEMNADACGFPLRPLNGCFVKDHDVEVRLPKGYWGLSQVAEYARAFQLRQGWDAMGMLNNISGGGGIFRTDALKAIGGYRPDTTAEDLASTFALHLAGFKIVNAPDVCVYTQVPETFTSIRSQRKRWARGLLDIMWDTKNMLHPRHGKFCLFALWMWIFEVIEPVIEVVGLAIITAKILVDGFQRWEWFTLTAGIVITVAMSVISILHREKLYKRLSKIDGYKVALLSFLEIFPFKIPLALLWRIRGMVEYIIGDRTWEALPRQVFKKE